jgi:hypothetical protein
MMIVSRRTKEFLVLLLLIHGLKQALRLQIKVIIRRRESCSDVVFEVHRIVRRVQEINLWIWRLEIKVSVLNETALDEIVLDSALNLLITAFEGRLRGVRGLVGIRSE